MISYANVSVSRLNLAGVTWTRHLVSLFIMFSHLTLLYCNIALQTCFQCNMAIIIMNIALILPVILPFKVNVQLKICSTFKLFTLVTRESDEPILHGRYQTIDWLGIGFELFGLVVAKKPYLIRTLRLSLL